MGAMASQITSHAIVYSSVNSGADQRKHQSSASLAFVRGIHRGPVNSLHKESVTRKMFPFDDIIMKIFLVDAFYFFINTPLPHSLSFPNTEMIQVVEILPHNNDFVILHS